MYVVYTMILSRLNVKMTPTEKIFQLGMLKVQMRLYGTPDKLFWCP
jgi:hypothetical protein